MKSKLAFILLLFITQYGLAQENYDADLIPANLRIRANSCIRNEEITVDMRAPDNVMYQVKKVITILNENGEDDAKIVLSYDKNTSIKSVKGEIYNAAGILTGKFNQSNFADVSAADGFSLFLDSRIKHYLPAENVYPYTVAYTYEIRRKQNLIIPDWKPTFADHVSIVKSSYQFIAKPSDELRIKSQHYNGQPVETIDEKQKRLVWTITNYAATRDEPYSPNPFSYLTSVQISPIHFTYYGFKGQYNNWQELGKWVYDDLLKNRTTLPAETTQMIKELVKNETSDKEKARKIYQFLQEKTRYISVQIGIGGVQPVAASEVDRLGYGDCKALVNYMQSLLKAADIESLYCVVEAGSLKKSLDRDFASMAQGNHIILCMPLKGDTTWLECTSQKIPFGFLSDFTDDRLVFACTAEGGKLLKTPKLTTQANLQVRMANLKINTTGDVTGKMNTIFYGSQYDNREPLIGKSLSEQHKLLKKSYNIDNIDFENIGFTQNKASNPNINEQINLNIRNYAPVNGAKMFLQLNAFNVFNTVSEAKNRVLPVYINRGFTDEDTVEYELPENVTLAFLVNEDKNYKNQFGEYVSKLKLIGNKLIYFRRLSVNEGTFPAESYADFTKFLNDVSAADKLKLAISLKK